MAFWFIRYVTVIPVNHEIDNMLESPFFFLGVSQSGNLRAGGE